MINAPSRNLFSNTITSLGNLLSGSLVSTLEPSAGAGFAGAASLLEFRLRMDREWWEG